MPIRINSIDLTDWQKDVVKAYLNPQHNTTIVVKAKRQVGKSICLQQIALCQSLNHNGHSVMVVSPTMPQSRRLYKELTELIYDKGIISKKNETLLEIEFRNRSKIYFKSAEQGDNLRGFNCNLLILDEAAFIDDEVFTLLQPATDAKNADVIMFSTPMWEDGFFYNYYQQGISQCKGVISIDWCEYDTSRFLSNDKLEMYRQQLPKQRFQTEYLGQFISSSDSGVFQNYNSCIYNYIPNSRDIIKAGIDWAADGQDRTVVIAMTSGTCHMVDILVLEGESPTNTIKKVTDFIIKNRVNEVEVEKNSIGAVYKDLLVKEIGNMVNIKTFNTTNDSKRDIIEKLATAFQTGAITIIKDDTLLSELSTYRVEKSGKAGKITYNAASGHHDDTVMSLAICYHLASNGNKRVAL